MLLSYPALIIRIYVHFRYR